MEHGKPTEATEELRKLLPFCVQACREIYGEGLLALLLFGSVARGNARFDSDIDLLLIADRLPPGRRDRFDAFSGRAVAPLERGRFASDFLRRIRRTREREGARRITLAGEECWDFRGPGGKGGFASFALDDPYLDCPGEAAKADSRSGNEAEDEGVPVGNALGDRDCR
ncbi:nucleotidyltransferase domain-containing protein [Methylacidimicrobium tartarophylax]|uniref:Polymerase nucleotidyl transferase domain-containing protein n=1 Tax=Methylacidimicrobium tartarophylax TaxID=1041768 RepID=A0A5E6MKN1_9BACT|nr:nucleotidyltransferase domain-containing protein [Methylacidimicrobium tartarophylax]VVM06607.1 hypothetical protein MAMT_01315 [Methylacidimicrobium tartarophylax]